MSYTNEAMPVVDRVYSRRRRPASPSLPSRYRPSAAEFAAVFHETIRINTLDYELYRDIQQIMINELDQASQVHISGRGGTAPI